MKSILTYCTARMFSIGLLPMAAMRAPKVVAENANNWQAPSPAAWGLKAKSH